MKQSTKWIVGIAATIGIAGCGSTVNPGGLTFSPVATAAPSATPTAAPVVAYPDACIALNDVKKGMWGAAANAFNAGLTSAESAEVAGNISALPVVQDFLTLYEDAQVNIAQLDGTPDAKAIAQYNADLPLYGRYFVGCGS